MFFLRVFFLLFFLSGNSFSATNVRDFVKETIKRHPELAVYKHRANESVYLSKIAKSKLYPNLSLNATTVAGESSIRDNATYSTFGINFLQPVYDPLSYREYEASKVTASGEKHRLHLNEGLFIRQTLFLILDYYEAKEHQKISKENYLIGKKNLAAAKERKRAGDFNNIEVTLFLSEFRNSLSEYQQRLQDESNKKQILEAYLRNEVPEDLDITNLVDIKKLEEIKDLGKDSHELKLMRKTVVGEKLKLSAAKAGHLPTLNLIARHGYNDRYKRSIGTERETVVGLSLNFSLYEGNKYTNQTALTKERILGQQKIYEIKKRELEYLLTNGISNLKQKQKIMSSVEMTANGLTEAVDGYAKRFENGDADFMEYLGIRKKFITSKHQFVSYKYSIVRDYVDILQRLGVLEVGYL